MTPRANAHAAIAAPARPPGGPPRRQPRHPITVTPPTHCCDDRLSSGNTRASTTPRPLDDHGRPGLDRLGRRRLRQRDGRELRRQLQDRADHRPRLANTQPARARDRRLRRLVQPPTPTLITRRYPPSRVRSAPRVPLRGRETLRSRRHTPGKEGNQSTQSPSNPVRLTGPSGVD